MTPPKRPNELYEEDNGRMPNWRPIPDPTVLTTQQLLRELAALKEVINTRMDGYDRAIELLQAFADRQPTIAEVVAQFLEKFRGIETQFKERDLRTEQTAKESKVAVDAAFSAQKEAVSEQNKSGAAAIAKSEAATTKQLDAITLLLQANKQAADEKIDDIKSRLTSIEGRGQAYSQGFGWIVSAVGVVSAVVGAIVAVFFKGSP
jgi:hypothetical protein